MFVKLIWCIFIAEANQTYWHGLFDDQADLASDEVPSITVWTPEFHPSLHPDFQALEDAYVAGNTLM